MKKLIASLLTSMTIVAGAIVPAYATNDQSASAVSQTGSIVIGSGRLEAKDGTTLTVSKEGVNYTVLTNDKTKLFRRFGGKSTLDEMQIGDTLNVAGKWSDRSANTIQARTIRDVSIQKRFGTFLGTVQSLTADGWVMTSIERGDQTVTVSADTKIVNRRGETISQADVQVGHRVRVKGMWDSANKTITEVTNMKDFSLPTSPAPVQ